MKLDHEEFAAFWSLYPRRTAKIDAMKAYVKARKLATAAEILAGLHGYCANLPEEVRFICHPATWLNQGRWMDEYPEVVRVERRSCPHTPRCNSKDFCELLIDKAAEGWHRDPETGKWSQVKETA